MLLKKVYSASQTNFRVTQQLHSERFYEIITISCYTVLVIMLQSMLFSFAPFVQKDMADNTHLLCRGKYHCMAYFLSVGVKKLIINSFF